MTIDRLAPLALAGVFALAACADEPDLDEGFDELDTEVAEETAPVAPDLSYGQWDADADRRLARDEFDGWSRDRTLFTGWNADMEDGLTSDEFAEGVFGLWDADQDDQLTENEWNEGTSRWFNSDADTGVYGEWDADADGALTRDEFRTAFADRGGFAEWDASEDGLIDETEFGDGLFGILDDNDDGFLDENEWNTWSEVMDR